MLGPAQVRYATLGTTIQHACYDCDQPEGARPITTIRAKMGHIAPINQVAVYDRIVAVDLDRDRAGKGSYRRSPRCNDRITGRVEAFIPPESGPVMQLSR